MTRSLPLLRVQYLGRLTLAAGIFAGALMVWPSMSPDATLLVTLALLLSLAVTLPSFWYTHVHGAVPGRDFLAGQAAFDAVLVTLVVHLTGGAQSDFAALYILVIAAAALLLPLGGAVLIGAFASMLYFADILWLHEAPPPNAAFVQIGLFAVMALVTGALADRLRRAGSQLGAVESELEQLRLDTGDILDAMDTGVVTVDAEGRMVYMNRSAAMILDMRERQWIRRPILETLDERVPGLGGAIRETIDRRVPYRRFEMRVPAGGAGDGGPTTAAAAEERVLGGRTTLLDREGEPWVTAAFQDITDTKEVEALNRRAERLQAVAELAASLAHEIKNPLASIRSAVEQMTGERLEHTDREVLERLVTTESDRLSRLLSEFIEFSRVQVRSSERVDLVALTREAIALVERHPDAGDGRTILFDPPDSPVRIVGDGDLLHRAVFNLTLNAAQHSRGDGAVRVALERVDEFALPAGVNVRDPVRLIVTDSGPGIPADETSRVFDPFYTTRRGGTGLGLALVHRAVEAHRGAIFLDDAPGGGARFTVYLPAQPAPAAVAAEPNG